MAKKTTIKVGDKVKLTSKFLKSTGQYVGGEGQSRWTVLAVDSGDFPLVTVDQPRADISYFTPEEIAADPMLKWRRIAACNLMLASKPDYTGI